jgi:nucleolar protein 58
MTLFILTETSAGYALFKAKDKKLLKRESLVDDLSTADGVCSALKLKKFMKYESGVGAMKEAYALGEGKVTPMLAQLLDELKDETKASLAVADPKLGNAITKLPGLTLKPISDSNTNDVLRAVREHLTSLIPSLAPSDIKTMNLGLSHSLSRHKLKFSPDKVDTMIVQAIANLDNLDKILNTYAMRVKEWYGWHFPELAKLLNDNMAYAKVIIEMGRRSNSHNCDLSTVLPEEIETAVKSAADISMGSEVSDEDLTMMQEMAQEVVNLSDYRQGLSNYLTSRMNALAPNLTALVGELVGARLIAHAGSLTTLAKSAGSTIQILGAEKALFRALKTKHDTPKYGLIYHASLVGQATGKNKGKIARMLASRAALGVRVDAHSSWGFNSEDATEPSEEDKSHLGRTSKEMIERRLRTLEGKPLKSTGNANMTPVAKKWDVKEARKYNPDADGLTGEEPAAAAKQSKSEETPSKKKLVQEVESEDEDETMADAGAGAEDSDSEDESPKKGEEKLSKAERKALKKARKAEREAKREAKAAKKAAKEAKKAAKEAKESSNKKRKHDEDGEKSEKKKKKKSKD